MSSRSRSPVFFTGCSSNLKDTCDSTSSPQKELLSPEDYKNFSAALESLFKYSKSPSVSKEISTKRQRPYLLPLPSPILQVAQNGSGKPSGVPRNNYGSLTSFEAEVYVNHKHHEVPSMGDATITMSPNTSLPNQSSFETPSHGRRHKRKYSMPAASVPEAQFHTPPLHSRFYDVSTPETSGFYIGAPQQSPHFQDFDPFVSPSYSRTSGVKRKSDSPTTNKRRRTFSPERRTSNGIQENPFSCMSEVMWDIYYNNRQSPEEQKGKFGLRTQLHDILRMTFPYCGLYIVGSTMNGMGTKNCDMDLCLMLSHAEIDQDNEAVTILEQVSRALSKYKFITRRLVIHAKVPILKFRDSSRGIDVDLNINNTVGIRNTQLLNSYSRLDCRVSPLVILTKLWAREYNINDAKLMTLSSYSLALMIIHYLQFACNPPVLPCLQRLQPEKYHPDSDVSKLKLEEDLPPYECENHQTLGELFLGFLDYYTNGFVFPDSVISVRTGGMIPREHAINVQSPKNKRAHWKFLSIEEPFDLTNTARSVFNKDIFNYITGVFDRSWGILNKTRQLSKILDVRNLLVQNR